MKNYLLVFSIAIITACSLPSLDEVLTDERTDYQKSDKLPPLEVPPDLQASETNEAMAIPGETATSASLKDYRNRDRRQQESTSAETPQQADTQVDNPEISEYRPATIAAGSTLNGEMASAIVGDGTSLAVRGDRDEIWLKLKLFFFTKGYTLDLDDPGTGVLVTNWSEQTFVENGNTYRYQYKIFADPGNEPDVTVFYIDNLTQEQTSLTDGSTSWIERGENISAVRSTTNEMNLYFNGQQFVAASQGSVATLQSPNPGTGQERRYVPEQQSPSIAEIHDVDDNKVLLAIPEEYTLAWRHTEQALQMAGLEINGSDQDKGLFQITYHDKEEGGWTSKLKKLKFWGNDEKQGVAYQVALTGVGNRTELVLLNENGDWDESENAETILSMIQTQYNRL